jgi:hydroxymethylbilane synthase
MNTLRIATRKSPLALCQAEIVAARLRQQHQGLTVELLPLSTRGDRLLDAPLAKVGGKGLFIKELEHALLDGRADIAVHSVKDVPVDIPEGLHFPVIMAREDPRDALISAVGADIDGLSKGARLGTSSLRRRCQVTRRDDDAVDALVAPLNDDLSAACIRAERAMNAALGGGCQVPIAGHAVLDENTLRLVGLVASIDGSEVIRASDSGPSSDPEALGKAVADVLIGRGARRILDSVYADA